MQATTLDRAPQAAADHPMNHCWVARVSHEVGRERGEPGPNPARPY